MCRMRSRRMAGARLVVAALLALMLIVSSCGIPQTTRAPESGESAANTAPAAPKRITIGISSSPPTLNSRLNLPSAPGTELAEELLNPGFVTVDNLGNLRPQLV